MSNIKLRIDNIKDIHNDQLIERLYASQHPKFNDKKAEEYIQREIKRRKELNIW